MTPQAFVSWLRAGWEVGGLAAPRLIGRYGRLTALNRTSRGRVIAKVPTVKASVRVQDEDADGDVVVPVYNNYADTAGLVEALQQDASISGIIFVNDGSSDQRVVDLLARFERQDSRVRVLHNDKNTGFVRTCNRGIMASTRDVVILNTDVVLPRGAISRLFQRLRADPATATVTPLSNCAYGVGFPELLYANLLPFSASVADVDSAFASLPAAETIELPSGIGFCMAMSRKVIDRIGVFDDAFGMGYGEETDFCMRVIGEGYKNVLATDCFVGHKSGQSFGNKWQELARKGTFKVLNRYPWFVDRVGTYLEHCETRAWGFCGLVRIAELASNMRLVIAQGEPDLMKAARVPTAFVSDNERACKVTVAWRGESYDFTFASRALFEAALALCSKPVRH